MIRAASGSGGFTLIESLMAMVLVAVTLLILGPVLFNAASQRVRDEGIVEREAVLRSEVNRLATLRFSSLDEQAGCSTVPGPDFPHTRCVTVAAVSSRERTITVRVTPVSPLIPIDSLTIARTSSRGNPFNTAQP